MKDAPDREITEILAALARSSPDAVIVVDASGQVVYASPATTAIFGYEPEELIGRSYALLLPDDRRTIHERHHAGFIGQRPLAARPMGIGLDLDGRRRDGRTIPVEVALVPLEAEDGVLVGVFVRDATVRRRAQGQMAAVNELMVGLLDGASLRETLDQIVASGCRLLGAAGGWVAQLDRDGQAFEIVSAHGVASTLVGERFDADGTNSAATLGRRQPSRVADITASKPIPGFDALGLGPALIVPLGEEGEPVAVLTIARRTGADPYEEDDGRELAHFADAAGVAVDLGQARRDLEVMASVAEHERIARDLHDTVIQRVFATAMRLESVVHLTSGLVEQRVTQTVADLDEIIRDIRTTIFNLQRPGSDHGVRAAVQDLVDESAELLGFQPRVGFEGAVDTLVPDDLREHLQAVLIEALSNVVRHAQAHRLDVVVAVDDHVTLSVADDGIGPTDGPTAGQGLRNLEVRAKELGGSLTLAARRPRGTLLEWTVPLAQ